MLYIYETIWADSPEQVEAKYQEIKELYPQQESGLQKKSCQGNKNNIRIIPNRRKDGPNVNHLF